MANENNNNEGSRAKILLVWGPIALSVVTAFWAVGRQALNNHESFVSVTAREMVQSGDWVFPTFNGEPRLNKTPLSYWLVGGISKITGRVDEFTARLPSATFAVLTTAAILYFVTQWLSLRTAALASVMWASSLCCIKYAHSARPEMAVSFFITLCLFSFYSAVNTKTRRSQVWYMLIFWVSFALANLAKGPIPVPLVMLPAFFYIAVFRKWGTLPKLLPIAGVIIFLVIILPWPLAVAERINWDFVVWKREYMDRFSGDYARGDYPFYYYFLIMFKYVTPWVAFLPYALAAPFFRVWGRKQHAMQYLWLWFVVMFVFLTISAGKRQHYILPAMPAMAILGGILLEDMVFIRQAYERKFVRHFLTGHLLIWATGFIALPVVAAKVRPQLLAAAVILSTAGLGGLLLIMTLFKARKTGPAVVSVFGSIGVWVMIVYWGFLNPLDPDEPLRRFTAEVSQMVPASEKLAAYNYLPSTFVHYFGRAVTKVTEKSKLYEMCGQKWWVVAWGKPVEELQKEGRLKICYENPHAELHRKKLIRGALFRNSLKSTRAVAEAMGP